MSIHLNRRQFLRGTTLIGLGLAAGGLAVPHIARAAASSIRIVSNPGLENATLNAMIEQLGLFKKFGVDDLPPVDVPIKSGSPGSRLLDGFWG